jgi:hypothetical protein
VLDCNWDVGEMIPSATVRGLTNRQRAVGNSLHLCLP